jgi:hypothetical protein
MQSSIECPLGFAQGRLSCRGDRFPGHLNSWLFVPAKP